MKITVERRRTARTGKGYGVWMCNHSFFTIRKKVWCICVDGKIWAEGRSKDKAETIAGYMRTALATERLVDFIAPSAGGKTTKQNKEDKIC